MIARNVGYRPIAGRNADPDRPSHIGEYERKCARADLP
jgi:hypothetical protein